MGPFGLGLVSPLSASFLAWQPKPLAVPIVLSTDSFGEEKGSCKRLPEQSLYILCTLKIPKVAACTGILPAYEWHICE